MIATDGNIQPQPLNRSNAIWFIAPIVLLVFVLLVSLGTWQLQRMMWKETLLTAISERSTAAPASVANVTAMQVSGADIEYRTVTASGVFDHGNEQFFFATHEGKTGYFVYTPLYLSDTRVVLVNRGFIPFDLKDRAKRLEGEVLGDVTVTGLARTQLVAKPSALVPENDVAKNIYYWKDMTAMADAAGIARRDLVPFFIDANDTPNPGGLPIGGVTIIDLPNNHLQYAITWFGVALALVIVCAFAYFQRNNQKR